MTVNPPYSCTVCGEEPRFRGADIDLNDVFACKLHRSIIVIHGRESSCMCNFCQRLRGFDLEVADR